MSDKNEVSIPTATISRLVTYLRILTNLERNGINRTSSEHLAEEAQASAFQVRKDLAYFGRFGTRGMGYTVLTLRRELQRILGLNRRWKVAISSPLVDDKNEFQGVFVLTVNLSDFELIGAATSADRFPVLVDGRQGESGGTILHHPLYEELQSKASKRVVQNRASTSDGLVPPTLWPWA